MENQKKKIKVLVIDDSAVVRGILSEKLNEYFDIQVVGTAPDPFIGKDKILELKPDVITLDVEMPRMDGLNFLKRIMTYFPIPTIILSSLTQKGGEMAIEALNNGAVNVMSKPGGSYSVGDLIPELVDVIRAASKVSFQGKKIISSETKDFQSIQSLKKTTHQIIAIGASTGGTKAIEKLLLQFPLNSPGIVIVQHMPEKFTGPFAERLNNVLEHEVKEAESGDRITPGKILIAPGNFHMEIVRKGGTYEALLNQNEREFFQRPAVDVMFRSLAQCAGANTTGIILTGMGKDGAKGIKALKDSGAYTIGQDEESSVVYGMPKAAFDIGGLDIQLPLGKIASHIFSKLEEKVN